MDGQLPPGLGSSIRRWNPAGAKGDHDRHQVDAALVVHDVHVATLIDESALARGARGRFEHPAREVGRAHVASAQDRGDAPPGEPLRLLEDRGDPKRC